MSHKRTWYTYAANGTDLFTVREVNPVTMLYDALDRLKRRTYSDSTCEETTYARLDAAT